MHLFDRAIGLSDADRELGGDVGDGEEAGFRGGRRAFAGRVVGAIRLGGIVVASGLVGLRRNAAHESTADTREAARTEAMKRARHAGAEGRYCDDDMNDS